MCSIGFNEAGPNMLFGDVSCFIIGVLHHGRKIMNNINNNNNIVIQFVYCIPTKSARLVYRVHFVMIIAEYRQTLKKKKKTDFYRPIRNEDRHTVDRNMKYWEKMKKTKLSGQMNTSRCYSWIRYCFEILIETKNVLISPRYLFLCE